MNQFRRARERVGGVFDRKGSDNDGSSSSAASGTTPKAFWPKGKPVDKSLISQPVLTAAQYQNTPFDEFKRIVVEDEVLDSHRASVGSMNDFLQVVSGPVLSAFKKPKIIRVPVDFAVDIVSMPQKEEAESIYNTAPSSPVDSASPTGPTIISLNAKQFSRLQDLCLEAGNILKLLDGDLDKFSIRLRALLDRLSDQVRLQGWSPARVQSDVLLIKVVRSFVYKTVISKSALLDRCRALVNTLDHAVSHP